MNTASNKVSKVGGIITAICLILLGILIFTFPIGSMVLSTWLFTSGVGIYGLFHILAYVKTPAGLRNGWQLAALRTPPPKYTSGRWAALMRSAAQCTCSSL